MLNPVLDLVSVQECRSFDEGWVPIRVESSSSDDFYTVFCNPWKATEEYVCQCKGYLYRGHCQHQEKAHWIRQNKTCNWREVVNNKYTNDYNQTPKQVERKICPKCEGPTRWVMELAEVEE